MSLENEFIQTLYHCGELFGRRSIEDFVKLTKESGLSMPQINILVHLYYLDTCEMSKVKDFISGDFAAASQIVDRLVERGLVERLLDDADRRIRKIRLTEQGKSLVCNDSENRQNWIREISRRFSEQEQLSIIESLGLLMARTKLE